MNPFNKNPFANKNTNTRIISNNINFNETQKIENIRENMNKIKFQNNQIKLWYEREILSIILLDSH